MLLLCMISFYINLTDTKLLVSVKAEESYFRRLVRVIYSMNSVQLVAVFPSLIMRFGSLSVFVSEAVIQKLYCKCLGAWIVWGL